MPRIIRDPAAGSSFEHELGSNTHDSRIWFLLYSTDGCYQTVQQKWMSLCRFASAHIVLSNSVLKPIGHRVKFFTLATLTGHAHYGCARYNAIHRVRLRECIFVQACGIMATLYIRRTALMCSIRICLNLHKKRDTETKTNFFYNLQFFENNKLTKIFLKKFFRDEICLAL